MDLHISEGSEEADAPVLVVTTGGTIDKVYFDAKSTYEVGTSVVGDLLRRRGETVTCDGSAAACDQLPLTECGGQDGCDLTGGCVGTASSCASLDLESCEDQNGCEVGIDCDGTAEVCAGFTDAEACGAQDGCAWGSV